MKAALLVSPRQFKIDEVPDPQAGPGEVRVRVHATGICGTDLHFYLGHRVPAAYPHIAGHELVGVIDQVGPGVTRLQAGQRVTIEPNYPCGTCRFCRQGRGIICPNKRIVGISEPGCFAELIVVPEDFAWAIPEGMSDNDAATIEPAAVGTRALKTGRARPGETVAVIGLGPIGLLTAHLAAKLGYHVLAIDTVPAKLELARRLGVQAASLSTGDNLAARLLKEWEAAQVMTVFECAGAPSTATLAFEAAPRGADVVLVGLSDRPAALTPIKAVRMGNDVKGTMIYDHPEDFARTIALAQSGVISPGQVVSAAFPLTQIEEAFQLALSGPAAKVLLQVT